MIDLSKPPLIGWQALRKQVIQVAQHFLIVKKITMADKDTAENYFTEHWAKHTKSLPKYGFQVKGFWIGNTPEIANQVIALVSFPDNANIDEMTELYMKSPEFADDMEGFDRSKITNVETKIMKSAEST